MDIKEFAKLLALDAEEALRIMAAELKEAKQELRVKAAQNDGYHNKPVVEVAFTDLETNTNRRLSYMAKNRDGSIYGYEKLPRLDYNSGRWYEPIHGGVKMLDPIVQTAFDGYQNWFESVIKIVY